MTDIGPFTVGEIPYPLTYTFLDSAGTAIDITGWDAVLQWGEKFAGGYQNQQENPAVVSDGPNGVVTYTWDGSEFTNPGSFSGQIWVSDGTQVLASCVFDWSTCLGVDTVPVF